MVKQWFISEDEGVCDECEGNADRKARFRTTTLR
jgi:hypothetical protein